MAEDEIPNRATVALVDAKVGIVDAKVTGLGELIKSENAATQAAITTLAADLKPLSVEVATLRANLSALDKREQDADNDMDRRVSAVEAAHTRVVSWWVTGLIALVAAVVGGLLGHAHIPLP